jgi:hypothetical protein
MPFRTSTKPVRVSGRSARRGFYSALWSSSLAAGLVLLVATCISICPASSSGEAPTGEIPLAPNAHGAIPLTYFAMNLAGSAWKHPWPSIDVGAVRNFDSAWVKVEPQRGVWDFTHLDDDIAEAQKHHAEVDLVLFSTPTWASVRPTEISKFAWQTPGIRAEAGNMADWELYVRTVSTRYKGKVHNYEMWNEPNLGSSFSGDVPQLVQLCKAAYKTLKSVDRSIKVISPSPAPGGGLAYLRSFLEAGGGGTFDVLGFHFYDNLSADRIHPESIVDTATQLRSLLASYKLTQKSIWNTESGYFIHSSPTAKAYIKNYPAHMHVLAQGEAVDAVARSYALGWACGIERFYWYGWGEPAYAIVDDNGNTSKDATLAYANITRWMLGATIVSVNHAESRWVVQSRSSKGVNQYIVWTNEQKAKFTMPKEWKVTEEDSLKGDHTSLSTTDIDLTGTPVLLH